MSGKGPEFHPDILDAICTLTEHTPGDIFYKMEAGEFRTLAIEALKAFSKKYYMMDRKEDTDPVDDMEILRNCLLDLQSELQVATDPVEIKDLQSDIDNIQQRIKS